MKKLMLFIVPPKANNASHISGLNVFYLWKSKWEFNWSFYSTMGKIVKFQHSASDCTEKVSATKILRPTHSRTLKTNLLPYLWCKVLKLSLNIDEIQTPCGSSSRQNDLKSNIFGRRGQHHTLKCLWYFKILQNNASMERLILTTRFTTYGLIHIVWMLAWAASYWLVLGEKTISFKRNHQDEKKKNYEKKTMDFDLWSIHVPFFWNIPTLNMCFLAGFRSLHICPAQ